jgi:DNA-binding NarL/FixJ family response regulator
MYGLPEVGLPYGGFREVADQGWQSPRSMTSSQARGQHVTHTRADEPQGPASPDATRAPLGEPQFGGHARQLTEPPWELFMVLGDAGYAAWLKASLATRADFRAINYAVGVAQAWSHSALFSSDIILFDCDMPGLAELGREVGRVAAAPVLLCTRRNWNDELVDALATAAGVLSADALTAEAITSAARAIRSGIAVLPIDHLRTICRDCNAPLAVAAPDPAPHPRLTPRERAVLILVAEGVPSREIAERLAYSERTIKNTLHDVLTRLNAKTRSHAVALAVREGII